MATSPITPSAGPTAPQGIRAVPPVSGTPPSSPERTGAAHDDAVEVDVLGSKPPASVLDAIAGASGSYDRLAAAGQHVSFGTDPATGNFSIQLQTQDGKVLSDLRPSDALALADGNAPDQTGKSPNGNDGR